MIDLAGQWEYKLDPENLGNKQHWGQGFKPDGKDFVLPGSNADNYIGKDFDYDGTLSEENVHMLRSQHSYRGKIWLQKKVYIKNIRNDRVYHLFLERVMWQTRLWINGTFVGTTESLSTPHEFDVTPFITEDNTITLCIDNNDIHDINTTPSAYTEETQTIWNGAIGVCKIDSSPFKKSELNITPSLKKQQVKIKLHLEQLIENDAELSIVLRHNKKEINKHTESFSGIISTNVSFSVEKIESWSEFDPSLYQIEVTVDQNKTTVWQEVRSFGFRTWTHQGNQLMLNNNPTFLRGTIDCALFPKTGYPPMNTKDWQKIFSKIKNYGFNHIRFHSWCPPEEAFTVADQLGLYLQVEGPLWLDDYMDFMVGDKSDHWQFFKEESTRIINCYGHHPSFSFFSCGNEVRGDYSLLRGIIKQLKAINSKILYTITTNWDREITPEDDIFMAQTVDKVPIRGQYFLDELADGTQQNYSEGISNRSVPVISHEVGQYSIYPSMNEIDKYTGTLRPTNFIAIRDDLKRKQMLENASDFTKDSGLLAFELYKNEIEAALRTPKMGGFQLLGLNDFTGQSTATVGLLDSFWEDKGIRDSTSFREFNNSIVPLAEFAHRIFNVHETFEFVPKVANYQTRASNVLFEWQVLDSDDQQLAKGQQKVQELPLGVSTMGGKVSFSLHDTVHKNESVTLILNILINGRHYANHWHLWAYEDDSTKPKEPSKILHSEKISDSLLKKVSNGQTLILTPKAETIRSAEPTTFFPVFRSPVHFKSKDNCGLHINKQNNLFNFFPSEEFADFEWKDLITNAYSISYENLENFEPLVQAIPNFFNNRKSFVLGEFKYGAGRVLISSLNTSKSSLSTRAFLNSLEKYGSSEDCDPQYEITNKQLKALYYPDGKIPKKIDLALGKPTTADTKLDETHGPECAVDGKNQTAWLATDHSNGHWWQVDLKDLRQLKQIVIHTLTEGVYYYGVSVSDDGQEFRSVINTIADTKDNLLIKADIDDTARYVRITYGDSNSEATIGHSEVNLY